MKWRPSCWIITTGTVRIGYASGRQQCKHSHKGGGGGGDDGGVEISLDADFSSRRQQEEERRARERAEDDKERCGVCAVNVAIVSRSQRDSAYFRNTARAAAQETFRFKKEKEQEETQLRLEQIKLTTVSAPPTTSVSAASHCLPLRL